MTRIAPYAKALVAALVAGLGSLYQALDGDNNVTAQEWVAVTMTTFAALGAVFAVSNSKPATNEGGQVQSFLVMTAAVACGFILGVILVDALHLR